MRKVFSSHRLENTEGVADLLRAADIEVRIRNGRSYKGNRRRTFSYADASASQSELWVVHSDDQRRAREILRDAGLIDSSRPSGGYITPTFRSDAELAQAGSPARKKLLRIKLGVLALIAAVVVAGAIHTRKNPPAPAPAAPAAEVQTASPPFDGSIAATLAPVAQAVLAQALVQVNTPVACLGVDGGDAPAAMIAALANAKPGLSLVPATACQEVANEDKGSYERATGQPATMVDVRVFRPSGPEHATVEVTSYHHRGWATYTTLEVARVGDQWQVAEVVKRVESRGLMGF